MDEKEQINKIVSALHALTIKEIDNLITSVKISLKNCKEDKNMNNNQRDIYIYKYNKIMQLITDEINCRISSLQR